MRKMIAAIAVLGLMSSGCAWLGFGDDSEASSENLREERTETAAEPAKAEKAETAIEQQKAAPAKSEVKKSESKAVKSAQKGKTAKGAKSEAQIKAELDQMGRKLAAQSARTLLPNKANKQVKKVGNEWVATYMHVDADNVTTEMRPGANGQYVGFIRYKEYIMQCKGATKQAALNAPCQQTGARRLNELIRYDGKAWQD